MPAPPPPAPADASWRRSGRRVDLLPAAFDGFTGTVGIDLAKPSEGLVTADGDRLLGLDVGVDG